MVGPEPIKAEAKIKMGARRIIKAASLTSPGALDTPPNLQNHAVTAITDTETKVTTVLHP